MGLVEDARKSLYDVRHGVGEFHGERMKQTREMAEEAGTNIPKVPVPRMCGIQTQGKHQSGYTL